MMRLLATAVLLAAPAESAFAAQWRPAQAVAQRPVRTAARAFRLAKISATVDSAAAEPAVVEPVATKPASTLAGLARWDPQAWVIPASWNTGPFRAAALVVTLGATAAGSTALGARAARFAHLIAFGSLLGSMVYTTFFAGLTMCATCIRRSPPLHSLTRYRLSRRYKNLPRQLFGKLQSKLFPLYFRLHAVSLVVMLGTIRPLFSAAAMPVVAPLVGSAIGLASTMINVLYLEPTSTKVMLQRCARRECSRRRAYSVTTRAGRRRRYKLEDEGKRDTDEYKSAAKRFGPLHGLSSLVNLTTLLCAVAHVSSKPQDISRAQLHTKIWDRAHLTTSR